jgi:SSS family solute:Na+ symporter
VAGLLDRDGVIALGILLSSRLSRLGVYTVSEMLENRYGVTSRLISAIIAVTSTIAIGIVFNVVLPLSSSVAILVAGGLVVAYSVACGR